MIFISHRDTAVQGFDFDGANFSRASFEVLLASLGKGVATQ